MSPRPDGITSDFVGQEFWRRTMCRPVFVTPFALAVRLGPPGHTVRPPARARGLRLVRMGAPRGSVASKETPPRPKVNDFVSLAALMPPASVPSQICPRWAPVARESVGANFTERLPAIVAPHAPRTAMPRKGSPGSLETDSALAFISSP
jgi:hypothetical protein